MKSLELKIDPFPNADSLVTVGNNDGATYCQNEKSSLGGQHSVPLPDEQVAAQYDIECITCAMDNSTDLQRDVLALRFMGERTVKETADLLARNEGAIKTLTRRAIAAVQRQLRREVRYE